MVASPPRTTGVLLMAYGSPSNPDDLEAYYTDIRRGRPPTPELLAELRARYRQIGGVSTLNAITALQAAGLQRHLDREGPPARVYVGMKHWQPRIGAAVAGMVADGVERAVALALAPHYSRLSVGDYQQRLQAALAAQPAPIQVEMVQSWHLDAAYVQAVASRVEEAWQRLDGPERAGALVLFTAHSLPSRILEWDDPYPRQVRETAAAVADALRLPRWDTAWQSAGRTPEPWLGPDIKQVVAEHAAGGTRAFVVCPVGFVADHMETLWDLDIDLQAHARALGVRVERSRSLNAEPDFIAALAGIVRTHLDGAP